jgi:predicted phage terminase large subunit-like protein
VRLATSQQVQQHFFKAMARGLRGGNITLETFIKKYLGHYFTAPPSMFHKELIQHLQVATFTRNVKSAIAGPRGSAKSTICSFAAPLWWTCEGLERYIVTGADTFSQSAQHLSHVKEELETNELLAEDYPHVVGKGSSLWSKESIITRNNVRIDALGAGKKVRGRRHEESRPTVVMIDDPENDEGARSPIVRERIRQWLDAGVLKAGQPGTNFFVNGTLINSACLMAGLLERPGWEHRRFQSIVVWPLRMVATGEGQPYQPSWEEWEKFYFDDPSVARSYYEKYEEELNEGAVVLWPERESLYDLMVMRAEGGHGAFMAEKQNSPMNPAHAVFDEMWFTDAYDIWYDTIPHGAYPFLAVDPSTGNDAKKGDFVAILEGFWKPGNRHYYIDGIVQRIPHAEIIPRILNMHARRNYVFCAFESNAFQITMAQQLQSESTARGISLPVLEIQHSCPKPTRIERLGSPLSKGTFKFARQTRDMKTLVKQIMETGYGDHDDGPDALEMLQTCIFEWVTHYYDRSRESPATILEVA